MACPPGARLELLTDDTFGAPSVSTRDPAPLPGGPAADAGGVVLSTVPVVAMSTTVVMPCAVKLAIIAALSPFFIPRSFFISSTV